jgi:hypothetical protein
LSGHPGLELFEALPVGRDLERLALGLSLTLATHRRGVLVGANVNAEEITRIQPLLELYDVRQPSDAQASNRPLAAMPATLAEVAST